MSRFCEDFGRNLKEMRVLRGMTQEQLAEAASAHMDKPVSVKTISAWERGTRAASIDQGFALALALDCSAATLCGSRSDKADQAAMRERFKFEVAAMPFEQKAILYHVLVDWSVNRRLLLSALAMIAGMPRKYRRYLLQYCTEMYNTAEENNELIEDFPQADVNYIEQELKFLK